MVQLRPLKRLHQTKMTLKTYLVLLATDMDRLNDFIADPKTAAEKSGLSAEDCAVLLSGDQNLIYATIIGGEHRESS